nr:MAG TPA: hypothetical protein [Caudoviricetes sp.]
MFRSIKIFNHYSVLIRITLIYLYFCCVVSF